MQLNEYVLTDSGIILNGASEGARPSLALPLAPTCVLGARVRTCGELDVRANFVCCASAARRTLLRVAGWPVAGVCRGWSLRGPNPAAVPVGSSVLRASVRAS